LKETLLRGCSHAGPIPLFDPEPYHVKRAFLVPPGNGAPEIETEDRAARFLRFAAREALDSAGLHGDAFTGPGTAVVLGTTLGGMDILKDLVDQPGDPRVASTLPYHAAADALADRLGAGEASTVSGACASSLMAIGIAAQWVRAGRFRAVLAGGFDAFCEFVHSGFSSLLALDPETIRPFDLRRRGLMIGEGAGAVLVETGEEVEKSGRAPLAEVLGFAALSDANHITGPHPDGEGLLRTLQRALAESSRDLSAVDAIHAHGTGTLYNDRMEGIAIRRFLGSRHGKVPVTASKGAIGHALGAAGALEAIACVMMLREGFVPPAVNFEKPDPACSLEPVTERLDRSLRVVVKSAAGFGGQNAVLVLGPGG
jgi:3-oxoacyl-(acyl-carrier-protein) synthase